MIKKRILSVLLILVAAVFSGGVYLLPAAAADDGGVEGIFRYTVTGNSEAVLTKCTPGTSEEITVPEKLGGYAVTAIGEFAFQNCGYVTKITLPEGIQAIGQFAFSMCYFLEDIKLPAALSFIGENAFSCCGALTAITLGAQVSQIENAAFSTCEALTAVNVVPENNYFSSEAGVLYNKDKTELYCYPMGKPGTGFVIPETVTTVKSAAFLGAVLSEILLPQGLTAIENDAFRECGSLSVITVPKSVEKIGGEVFMDCAGDLTIRAYYNTPARSYAKSNKLNFEYIPLEYDASGDGIADISDMTLFKKHLTGCCQTELSPDADCNKDNKTDIKDLIRMKKYFANTVS